MRRVSEEELRAILRAQILDENGFPLLGIGVAPIGPLIDWVVSSVKSWDLSGPAEVVVGFVGVGESD